MCRTDMTAIEQLELWLAYQENWCHHKPSVTISVKQSEWLHVGAWVYDNFDSISGISFLPFSDHVYAQAPYQDCSKEEYENALHLMPLRSIGQSWLHTNRKTILSVRRLSPAPGLRVRL